MGSKPPANHTFYAIRAGCCPSACRGFPRQKKQGFPRQTDHPRLRYFCRALSVGKYPVKRVGNSYGKCRPNPVADRLAGCGGSFWKQDRRHGQQPTESTRSGNMPHQISGALSRSFEMPGEKPQRLRACGPLPFWFRRLLLPSRTTSLREGSVALTSLLGAGFRGNGGWQAMCSLSKHGST
jgi:hypothetical protein